jgi:hypothetical protein
VDKHAVHIGKLYSVLEVDSCVHGLNGGPAIFNSLGIGRDGAYAEYMITTADTLAPVVRLSTLPIASIPTYSKPAPTAHRCGP